MTIRFLRKLSNETDSLLTRRSLWMSKRALKKKLTSQNQVLLSTLVIWMSFKKNQYLKLKKIWKRRRNREETSTMNLRILKKAKITALNRLSQ